MALDGKPSTQMSLPEISIFEQVIFDHSCSRRDLDL